MGWFRVMEVSEFVNAEWRFSCSVARLENGDIFASFRAASGWTRRVANQVVSSWESLYFFLETEQDQWWNEQGRW